MPKRRYPENLSRGEPTSLNPADIWADKMYARIGIAVTGATIAVFPSLLVFYTLPATMEHMRNGELDAAATQGGLSALAVGLTWFAADSLRSYREQLRQANFNRIALQIDRQNELDA